MADKIIVPTLGESVTEATVSRWLKNQGEEVSADEPIVELETDKVNVEVPSPSNGVLEKISVKEGETVNVGASLGMINGSPKQLAKEDKEIKKYSPPKKNIKTHKEKKVTQNTSNHTTKSLKLEEEIKPLKLEEEIKPLKVEEETLILDNFVEFAPFAKNCNFLNCTHLHEPSCAVKQALENGEISDLRYRSYKSLSQTN